jgi:RNA polymerase sigma-70 factor, ECF subfamily
MVTLTHAADPTDAAALQVDDGEVFGRRLAAELPRLVRLATRLVRDADTAEDLAQDTVVTAWRRRHQLRSEDALGAWLRRALVRRVVDHARSSRPTVDLEAVERDWRDDAFTVQPERVLERAELRDELEDALSHLPAIYRVPLVLHDAAGWTMPDIAEASGIGLPAAKQRLRRGRMMLVSALADDDARRRASLAQPLRCWTARRHVSSYLDGELGAETRAAVEGHLAQCPTCPPLYAALVGVTASMGELRDTDSVIESAMARRIELHLSALGRLPAPGRRRGRPPTGH